MTKSKKVTLKISFEEASHVLMSLIETQRGYTEGPAVPERIVQIRSVMNLLDAAMDEYIGSKTEE